MIISVSDSAVDLRDPHNVTQFHVEAAEGVDVGNRLAEAHAGRAVDAEHVFVNVEWVRQAAAAQGVDAGWVSGFAAMLDFAATKDWLDPDGAAIRAHIERT